MRARLEVHAGDPDQPELATLHLTRALVAGFPRQRPVTLALVGLAPHPGLTVTPWALDGVLEACVEGERTPVNLLALADADTDDALLRKASRTKLGGAEGRELVERPSPDRLVSLRSVGQRRPFAVPRELVGSSLILVAPLLLRAHEHGRVRHWQGPLSLALEQLARAWGYRGAPAPKLSTGLAGGLGAGLKSGLSTAAIDRDGREAAAAGLALIQASFASAAVVVDATWAGALEPVPASPGLAGRIAQPGASKVKPSDAIPRLLGELASPDRALALADLDRLELDAVLGVDQFLAKQLGLDSAASRTGVAPELGERSPGRWPSVELFGPRSQPTRLADRAIAGIRSQSKRLSGLAASVGGVGGGAREQAALPARVPGRFAPQWTARWYGDHDRTLR